MYIFTDIRLLIYTQVIEHYLIGVCSGIFQKHNHIIIKIINYGSVNSSELKLSELTNKWCERERILELIE